MDKLLGFCLGGALIALSITLFLKPSGYYLGHHLDFSEIRPFFSAFLLILGSLFIWTAIRKKK